MLLCQSREAVWFWIFKNFLKINFLRGLASDGEPTSGIFKLKKFCTDKKFDFKKVIIYATIKIWM